MTKGTLAALFTLLAGVTLPAHAELYDAYSPDSTRLVLEGGVTGGGDKLATVQFNDGGTSSIYAGNSVFGDVGVLHTFGYSGFSFKGTLGYAFDNVHASNGNFTFDYMPIDLMGVYNIGDHHIGAGLTYHANPKLTLDGFGPDADFDSATGVVLQYQYWLFAVRYTNIRYKVSSFCNAKCSYDGSSLGFVFSYAF